MIFVKRKTIGLLINKTDAYFDDSVSRMIQTEAKRLDYDVFVFCTVGYHSSNNKYDRHEQGMLDLVPLEQLDGIIVVPDSYELPGTRQALMDTLRERASCPVVAIRYHGDPYPCIYTDETRAIRPIIRHLIEDHKLTDIRFLSGYRGHVDAELRLQCYREEMASHGLTVRDEDVLYGEMWLNDGPPAYRHFFEESETPPQAVVCANDYMAVSLIRELNKHGIRVPEDCIVTGFDHIQDTELGNISLTTVAQDYDAMVRRAMNMLDKYIRSGKSEGNEPAIEKIGLPGRPVFGTSCGCGVMKADELNRSNVQNTAYIRYLKQREVSMTYFSIEASACDSLSDLHEVIIRKSEDIPEQRDFYLCLFEEENTDSDQHVFAEQITDRACLVSAMRDRKDNGMPMISFDRRAILPPMADRPDEAQTFFVMLLHRQERCYGYAVSTYLEGEIPSNFYHHWNVVLAGAVRNIHIQGRLQRLYEERRQASVTDPMTRMLNRRGFEEQILPRWDQLCLERANVTFVYFDMDNLKTINDRYGHADGDNAIRMLGRAIIHSAPKDSACARMGGDEFVLFMPNTTRVMAERYPALFEQVLSDINSESRKPYKAVCSYGIFTIHLEEGTQLETCIQYSDEQMYKMKSARKKEAANKK
ncbi:MAG: GGDEF domain-containing protein [Clostridia bacterium]|nr:GGDEF domain-containing protein [Clostridia bacterium]